MPSCSAISRSSFAGREHTARITRSLLHGQAYPGLLGIQNLHGKAVERLAADVLYPHSLGQHCRDRVEPPDVFL